MEEASRAAFEAFVNEHEPGLRRALVAAYGFGRGREATADALSWAWEHWARVSRMSRPAAYLFRVGQSSTRRRKVAVAFAREDDTESWFEPGLGPALAALSERQRIAVVLVHGFDWTMREVAELTGVRVTTVQSHLERGLRNLRLTMEVADHA
jgi:DNA-directed RNA polymerase specialized sigma24 family protein